MSNFTTVEADPEGAAAYLRALKQKSVVDERREEAQTERPNWIQVSHDEVRNAAAKDSIWHQPMKPQGLDFEKVRNVNLGSNCPHIDDIVVDAGTVTQHKSMELTLPSYQNIRTMQSAVERYIDHLDERTKGVWYWTDRDKGIEYRFERGANFQDRYLELGIPAGQATQAQVDKLLELQEYAQSKDVTMVIVEVP